MSSTSSILACNKTVPGNAGVWVCAECASSKFFLSDDKTVCILPAEERFQIGVLGVLTVLVALILFSCTFKTLQSVYERVKELYVEAQNAKNFTDLQEHLLGDGLAHFLHEKQHEEGTIDQVIKCAALNWRYKLMQDWSTASKRLKAYNPLVNLNEKNVIGVGLPHFYNFHILPLMLSFLSMLEKQTPDDVLSTAARAYTENLWCGLGCLYIAALLMSWFHAYIQIAYVRHFDRSNSMMGDFAVELFHLPINMTSENQLWNLVKQVFENSGAVPIGVSIGYDLTTQAGSVVFDLNEYMVVDRDVQYLKRSQEFMKRYGASRPDFGYAETLAKYDHVPDDEMERRFKYIEGNLRGSGHAWVVFRTKLDAERVASMYDGFWLQDEVEYFRTEHHDWMNAMMPGGAHYDDFSELWEDQVATLQYDITVGQKKLRAGTIVKLPAPKGMFSEEEHPGGRGHKLLEDGTMIKVERRVIVKRCENEPLTVMWYSLGTGKKVIACNTAKAILWTLLVFIIILGLVYVPYSTSILQPYAEVNAFPGQVTSQTFGFLLGLCNNILGAVMGMKAWAVGFSRKSSLDLWVLGFNIIVTIFNTVFNLIFAFYYALEEMVNSHVDLTHFGSSAEANFRASLTLESNMTTLLYNLMWPGWLFSGFLTGQLMGIVVPWIQNWILLQVVFKAKCLPMWLNKVLALIIPWNPDPEKDLTIRMAEKVFCPPEISLAWDYADKIVTPSVCLLTLFFLSPDMWMIFPRLLQWVAFMYLFHRYVHLLLCKKQLHVDARLGDLALFLWSLPLGIIAAAWTYWTYRLGYVRSPILVPISFFASVWVYTMGLMIILLSDKGGATHEKDKYYDYVEKFLLYSWFNCNPVHILKSCYGELKGVTYSSTVPFVFGKEYLTIGNYSDEEEDKLKERQDRLAELKQHAGTGRMFHCFLASLTKFTPLFSLFVLIASQFIYNLVS